MVSLKLLIRLPLMLSPITMRTLRPAMCSKIPNEEVGRVEPTTF